MERRFLFLASLGGSLAIILGAFGAHVLKGRLDPAHLEIFDVAVRYHMAHALALLGLAALLSRRPADIGCSTRQDGCSSPVWCSSRGASISSPSRGSAL